MAYNNLYNDGRNDDDPKDETQRQEDWDQPQNPTGQKGGQSSYQQDQGTSDTSDYGQDVVDIGKDENTGNTEDFLGSDSLTRDEEEE